MNSATATRESALGSSRSIVVFIDTTDRGTDQMARKRRTASSVEAVEQIIYIPSDCYLHVFHAAVRSGLALVDQLLQECFSQHTLASFGKYYGSLGKVVNLWREKAAEIMRQWSTHHSAESEFSMPAQQASGLSQQEINDLGKRYPLSVSSGRWGSIEAAEEFLIQRGRALTEPVLLQVLSRSMKADKNDDAAGLASLPSWLGVCNF